MEFYKIPYDVHGSKAAATFNQSINAEIIEGAQDVYKVDWVTGVPDDAAFIGHKVCLIPSQGDAQP